MTQGHAVVVGGGLAGLSATMKLAEKGCKVTLVSITKVKRSHSVCAQGGINAAINLKDEMEAGHVDLALGLLPQLKAGFFRRRLWRRFRLGRGALARASLRAHAATRRSRKCGA